MIAVTRNYYEWRRNRRQAWCQPVSSEDYESYDDQFPDQVRDKARESFEIQPGTTGEEYDFAELFVRILWERDWTDKLASILSKIRNRFRLRNTDTKLSGELRALIPDMNEVVKAYAEMTGGYKEFIRTVLQATNRWQEE